MEAQDFLDWMDKLNIRKASEIVAILGIGRNQAQTYVTSARAGKSLDLKHTIALAMTAAAHDFPAWGEKERTHNDP